MTCATCATLKAKVFRSMAPNTYNFLSGRRYGRRDNPLPIDHSFQTLHRVEGLFHTLHNRVPTTKSALRYFATYFLPTSQAPFCDQPKWERPLPLLRMLLGTHPVRPYYFNGHDFFPIENSNRGYVIEPGASTEVGHDSHLAVPGSLAVVARALRQHDAGFVEMHRFLDAQHTPRIRTTRVKRKEIQAVWEIGVQHVRTLFDHPYTSEVGADHMGLNNPYPAMLDVMTLIATKVPSSPSTMNNLLVRILADAYFDAGMAGNVRSRWPTSWIKERVSEAIHKKEGQ